MIILVQRKKGNPDKSVKMILTPAPFSGELIQSYRNGVPNSWSWYSEGKILELWYKDGNWVFLGRGTRKWEKKILPMMSDVLEEQHEVVNQHSDPDWWKVIQENTAIKKERFVKIERKDRNYYPFHTLAEDVIFNKLTDHQADVKLTELPVLPAESSLTTSQGEAGFIGRQSPTQWNSGFSGKGKGVGTTFGTVMNTDLQTTRVDRLSFHLSYNGYKNITFNANLYLIEDGQIKGRINQEKIVFSHNDDKGWVSIPIGKQILKAKSRVLITLKIIDMEGKGNNSGIFFSLDDSPYLPLEKLTGQKNWGIWEGNFSFFLSWDQ